MEERNRIVCCPAPVSDSQTDPIPLSGVEKSCHCEATVPVQVGYRCGRRGSGAVNSPAGAPVLRLRLHRHLSPVAAAPVATLEF